MSNILHIKGLNVNYYLQQDSFCLATDHKAAEFLAAAVDPLQEFLLRGEIFFRVQLSPEGAVFETLESKVVRKIRDGGQPVTSQSRA